MVVACKNLSICSLEVVPPVDGKWGSLGADGKWNGMVGMVLYGVSVFANTLFTSGPKNMLICLRYK